MSKVRNYRDRIAELEYQLRGPRIMSHKAYSAISREIADLDGRCAYLEGRPRETNPNDPSTVQFGYWDDAWCQEYEANS